MQIHPFLILLTLATSLLLSASGRPIQRELLQVPSRTGVLQQVLLITESTSPKAVALMFPGGAGYVGLGRKSMEAVFKPQGNFLIRAADQFLSPDLAIAILDCPTDQSNGMDDGFRASADHAADVKAVMDLLHARFKELKVFLVGTSRGTVSAAYAGEALGKEVDGIVLTSSVFNANKKYMGLSLFPFERLKAPLLLVHHAEDGCPVCPYGKAVKLKEKQALITVRGSIEPESGPCDPLSNHGYFGREAQVAAAVRGWILGQPFATDIP